MKENFISCVLWVPKGVSKSTPDEVKLSPEELKELIQETRSDIKDIEPDFEDEADLDGEDEDETEDKEEVEESDESEEGGDEEDFEIDESAEDNESEENNEDDAEEKHQDTKDKADDSDEDIISKYDLDNYDDDDGDGRPCMQINDVTMFVDNRDDQYMEESNSEDEDKIEEKKNLQIKENDNLLVVGHIEGERCTVEVYVYNKEDDDFYVHHGMDMAAYPVALEWMDFHPSDKERGSYVVVGDMTPVISVWDLDVVGASVPDYCLGKKLSKKKQKKTNLIGHTEPVVSLSWNKKLRNILASGSADKTIILWDLRNCKGEKLLEYHKGDVQALEWDPFEYNYLLSGCTAGLIRIYDYRTDSDKAAHKWKVEGEIERVCWNKSQSSKFLCSTDQGFVYSFDINVSTYQHCIKAHVDSVTVLDISPDYPNLLMTGGYDQLIKVWDLDMISKKTDEALRPVYSNKTVVAKIYAAKFAPDSELIIAVGGHCSSNNLKIMDLGELKPGMKSVEIPENDMNEELASPKKKKNKKLQKFRLSGEQQSTENDVYAAGSSSTENMTENVDKSALHLPSFQLKKKKKKKLQKFHLNGEQQSSANDVNAAGAGSSSTENMTENVDENALHLPSFQLKKKKKKKLQKFHLNGEQQSSANDVNAAGAGSSSTENMTENALHLPSFQLKKKKKKKLQKFHLNGEQQSSANDVNAAGAGSSSTENMIENVDKNALHSPSFQLKKKKKLNRCHPYEQQQNAYSAGPSSCTNDNHNFVPKKKKRKHSQIN